MARLLAIGLFTLVLAGCGSSSNDEQAASTEPGSPPPMATTTTTTTSDKPVACSSLAGAGLKPLASGEQEGQQTMFLTGVSLGSAGCSDTVAFTFEKHAPGPGYQISYERGDVAKVEDGSGNPVAVAGEAFLVVKLKPAMTAKIEGDQVTRTYTGPRRIAGDAGSPIREVVKTGDFENVVTWAIGLDSAQRFTAETSSTQLVVEIER